MKNRNPDQEHECPLCGEYLVLNREGTMTNKNNGEFIYVYTCEECNQAFALDNDNKMKLLSYDAEMKPIKNECKICKTIKNYNQEGLFLLNVDTAYYEFHCFDCAILILQKWADKNLKKKTKITRENANEIYEIYDFTKNNEMLEELNKNPQKYKETMDKVKKHFDNIGKESGETNQKGVELK